MYGEWLSRFDISWMSATGEEKQEAYGFLEEVKDYDSLIALKLAPSGLKGET